MTILNKFILTILLVTSNIGMGSTIFSTSFEDGTLDGLICSGNCPITTTTNSLGKYSSNFTLTRSMPVNYRTEVVLGDKGQFQFGKEYWLEFNYRYEDWVKDSDPEIAPFQIHARSSSWDDSCSTGAAVSNAPFLMVSKDDQVKFVTYGYKVLWSGPIQKKQWLNMSVHFKISTGSDGFVEAWKDGVKIGMIKGANSPKLDKCGLPMNTPYFKMGIYKWNWKTKVTDSNKRALLIDNMILSDTPLKVNSDTTPPIISNLVVTPSYDKVTFSYITNELVTKRTQLDNLAAISDTVLSKTHLVTVENLTSNTNYIYKLEVTDASDNTFNLLGNTTTLSPPDTTPPIISKVTKNLTDTSLTVNWTTDEKADSKVLLDEVEYQDPSLVTSHSKVLPMTFGEHVLTVSSKDAAGNVSNDTQTIAIGACLK